MIRPSPVSNVSHNVVEVRYPFTCSRRVKLFVCFPLILESLISTAMLAAELPKSADAFLDSIGVNTHYGNAIYIGGNAYANPDIDAKLGLLGVRHLRDHSWNDTAVGRVDGLYSAYGIRSNLILGETTRSPADLQLLLKK